MNTKVDLRKSLDGYRAERGRFRIVDVPEARYLMLDGQGDPNTAPQFAEAVAALYPMAYKLKFASKVDLGRDYVVPPLEGLWWAEDMRAFTTARNKAQWNWTMMVMVPTWIDASMFPLARDRVAATKNPPLRLDDVRLEALTEGRCVQTLHVGSFDDEAAVLAQLHDEFVPAQGLRLRGLHHEIYLSDFRRTPPDRRRTILRQPVSPIEPPADQ
ncbi:MAG: GyrI-like domain-containing protein [Acidimicrobiales bacterium]